MDFDGEFYSLPGRLASGAPAPVAAHTDLFQWLLRRAIEVAARHADTYMLWASCWPRSTGISAECAPPPRPRDVIRASGVIPADRRGYRGGRLSVPPRCSNRSARTVRAWSAVARPPAAERRFAAPLAAAEQGEVLDSRLWTGVARLTGARWNSTAPGRHPEQVAAALGEYYRLGVSTFLIRGFDPPLATPCATARA